MKILVTSDTHGRHSSLDIALEQMKPIDMFIHLGDHEDGLNYINEVVDCEKHMIRGNNDFFSRLPAEKEFYIGEKKVFMTHGHVYKTWKDMDALEEAGRSRGADIIMFGHAHIPHLEIRPDITILNPGSLTYPRQIGRLSTFILMEVDSSGDIDYSVYHLERNTEFVKIEGFCSQS